MRGTRAPALRPTTDGIVTIRPPAPPDTAVLVAGRDAESVRFLGLGGPTPNPVACIQTGGEVVGWADYDNDDRHWLADGELNLGYNLFAEYRGRGLATRAVRLLVHHLAVATAAGAGHRTATLLIHPSNDASLAVAARAGFVEGRSVAGERFFSRAVPPLAYSDGVVTIRPQRADDLDRDLEAKDDEQIDWLWLPGQREQWEAMSPADQRAHALRGLEANAAAFGTGPKWTFAVDAREEPCVAYVDADLANPHVPAGEANISYACHPAYRGNGYVSRSVRMLMGFLRDHTGASEAHIVVDERNVASRRVAAAAGFAEVGRYVDDHGAEMIRHVAPVRRG